MLKKIELETNQKSIFYHIDPLLKIATVAQISFLLILIESIQSMLILNVVAILITLFAKLSRRQYFFLFINVFFLVYGLAFSQGMFYQDYPKTIFIKFHLFAVDFLPEIILWKEGIFYGMKLSLRFIPNVLLAFVIFTSTNPDDFLKSLNRLRTPHILSYMISISIRFIPILYDNYIMVRSIQTVNGYRLSLKQPIRTIKTELKLVVPVLFHTYRSAVHLAESMRERGFNPKLKHRNSSKKYNLSQKLYLFILVLILFSVISIKVFNFLYLNGMFYLSDLRFIYQFSYEYL
jgi:energy-coupling factor transport system permease protein